MDYAGFWVRVGAYLIDFIVLLLIQIPIVLISGVSVFDVEAQQSFGFLDVLSLFIGIAYFVGFEGSSKQATPGKMAVGVIVTDETGGRISYPRAFGRYLGKIVSALVLLIGYIMIGFHEKKQGLHDIMAGTYVVRGTPGNVGYNTTVFE